MIFVQSFCTSFIANHYAEPTLRSRGWVYISKFNDECVVIIILQLFSLMSATKRHAF